MAKWVLNYSKTFFYNWYFSGFSDNVSRLLFVNLLHINIMSNR